MNLWAKKYFTFPEISCLALKDEIFFAGIGAGYRAKYLSVTSKALASGVLSGAENLEENQLRKLLISLQGVGPKVADCILLFGLNYLNAFPVDTCIKKVMERLYLKRSATKSEIEDFAKNAFKEYAGIAQQYLFYYARENKIKGID